MTVALLIPRILPIQLLTSGSHLPARDYSSRNALVSQRGLRTQFFLSQLLCHIKYHIDKCAGRDSAGSQKLVSSNKSVSELRLRQIFCHIEYHGNKYTVRHLVRDRTYRRTFYRDFFLSQSLGKIKYHTHMCTLHILSLWSNLRGFKPRGRASKANSTARAIVPARR